MFDIRQRIRKEPRSVLVLGNDPFINQIQFERLKSDVITLGVNRIWLKHIPNYFFYNDAEITLELNKLPEVIEKLKQKSVIFASNWLTRLSNRNGVGVPPYVRVYDRKYGTFADSVTTAMQIFNSYIIKEPVTYYIAGVSLTWQEPSHFWNGTYDSLNNHGERWYKPRFSKIYDNFLELRRKNFNMISVTPRSKLNKVFPSVGIEHLYV